METIIVALVVGWNLIVGTGVPPAAFIEDHECAASIWEYRTEGKDAGWVRLDQPQSEYEMSQYLHDPMSTETAYWVYCEVNDAG